MSMQCSGSIRWMLITTTGILTMVSIVFTELLWARLPEDFLMQCLTGLAGLALELCKFSLLPLSFLQLRKRQWLSGGFLMSLGSALFVVSIGASVSFLETGQQRHEQRSLAWQQRQETIAQLDNNITLGQESASIDIRNGYRERGAVTLKQVDQWQKERASLLSQPLANDGQMVGLTEQQRFFAWLLLALLIDGCSVAGWSILSGSKKSLLNDRTVVDNNVDVSECVESVIDPAIVERIISGEPVIDPAIVDRIISGEYGYKISIRGVMEKEQLGYKKIKPVFDQLESQGVIKQAAKGYELLDGKSYPLL